MNTTEAREAADKARAEWDAAEDAYNAARRTAWADDTFDNQEASREAFSKAEHAKTVWYRAEERFNSARAAETFEAAR